MKIYVCLLTETTNLWHREVLWSLRDMGHRVFSPENIGLNESWYRMEAGCWSFKHRDRLTARLLGEVRRVHQEQGLQLFFVYLFPFQFDPRVLREIERMGIPAVFLYCDNLSDYTAVEEVAGYATLTWVPEAAAVNLYRKRRRNFIHLPLGCNPNFNKPTGAQESRGLVCIVSKSPYRRRLLGTLIQMGVELEVYGNEWRSGNNYYRLDDPPQERRYEKLSSLEKAANLIESKRRAVGNFLRFGLRPKIMARRYERLGEEFEPLFQNPAWGYPLSPERMVEMFSESRVILGINHYIDPGWTDPYGLTFSKLRDFEVPMSGACYLTQYTPELDGFYPEPDLIQTYRTVEELRDKARMLLGDKGLRDRMRQNVRRFCLEHHTWRHRFAQLFRKLGLKDEAASAA